MNCEICGLKTTENLCEFCGSFCCSLDAPLISRYDIEHYQDHRKKILSREHFTIIGDILRHYTGSSDVVIIPDEIRIIDEHCFKDATVKKVKIPANVEVIGTDAYESNNGAFEPCKELEEVAFADNSKLKSIEKYAFSGCINLKRITGLPKSIKHIKPHSFKSCALDNISINVIKNSTANLDDDWDK